MGRSLAVSLILSAAISACSLQAQGAEDGNLLQPEAAKMPATRPIAAQTVDLRFVELSDNLNGFVYHHLRNGKLQMPFPNAAGKITIERRGGNPQTSGTFAWYIRAGGKEEQLGKLEFG